MKNFDHEMEDINDSAPKHFNGTVTTAGTPTTLVSPDASNFTSAIVSNPAKGPNENTKSTLLFVSFDAGTTYMTLERGTSISITANFANIKIDTDTDGASYEVITTY